MFTFFTYEHIKRLSEERHRRGLELFAAHRREPVDSYVRPRSDADVIEVEFGTACASESVGA